MDKMLLTIAFLGLLVSGYLLITYVSPVPLSCTSDGGCHVVQATSYAYLFGLPTPLYGVIYYFFLGITAALKTPQPHLYIDYAAMLLTGSGFAVSAWLTYLEAFIIHAWCVWCVASAILATIAFILVWGYPKKRIPTTNDEPL